MVDHLRYGSQWGLAITHTALVTDSLSGLIGEVIHVVYKYFLTGLISREWLSIILKIKQHALLCISDHQLMNFSNFGLTIHVPLIKVQ